MGVLDFIFGIFIAVMVFLTIVSIFYMKYDRNNLEIENTKLQKDLRDLRAKNRNKKVKGDNNNE